MTAAVGAASRRGILIGDSRVLETVRRVDLAVLDKTGTITRGDFRLLEADPSVLGALAGLERYSEHPLGAALVTRAAELGIPLGQAAVVQVLKGRGITGEVDGEAFAVGSRRLMAELGINLDPALVAPGLEQEQAGRTVAYWQTAGRAGRLVFGDELRPDARPLVEALHARRVRVAVVSGDSEATTSWAARAVGADEYRAEATPERKAAIVDAYQAAGRTVAMLGDGVNDAPALAQARLGIAMGTGADLAMRAAPVVLMAGSLDRVIEVFELAAAARRVVGQNLFWAFAYNTVGIALAITGRLNPILAAGAMVLSSLSVIANSHRLSRLFQDR
jgi:P-type E1-E2 ATPase